VLGASVGTGLFDTVIPENAAILDLYDRLLRALILALYWGALGQQA
jgi:hypothetical protein